MQHDLIRCDARGQSALIMVHCCNLWCLFSRSAGVRYVLNETSDKSGLMLKTQESKDEANDDDTPVKTIRLQPTFEILQKNIVERGGLIRDL